MKKVKVSGQLLVELLSEHTDWSACVVDGLPPGSKFVDACLDFPSMSAVLFFENDSFDDVPREEVGELDITIKAYETAPLDVAYSLWKERIN